jgi:TatD DNase family protein
VYAAVGVHPHDAARFDGEREEVEALLDAEKVVAVGEIGLDYYRERAPRDCQRRAFEAQLQWAKDRNLPVSVHNREADADVLDRIEATGARAVMHAFSAPSNVAARALAMGALISIAGNVTFRNADNLRDVVRTIPDDRILIESDAPVLAPQPRRGRTNEPAYVAFTLDCLAEVRDTARDELMMRVAENARCVFQWNDR